MMNQHREKEEVRGGFQLKVCEEEIRTERIKERVSCGCVTVYEKEKVGLLGAFCCLTMQEQG